MEKASKIIRECLQKEHMTQTQVSSEMDEDNRLLSQQMNRSKDMKVGRFSDVLEHIGYHVEIVSDDGVRKADPEFAEFLMYDENAPDGFFYSQMADGYVGICRAPGLWVSQEFPSLESCKKWLREIKEAEVNASNIEE